MITKQNKNTLIVANLIELVQSVWLQGDGAGYTIPEDVKNNPKLLTNTVAKMVELNVKRKMLEGVA